MFKTISIALGTLAIFAYLILPVEANDSVSAEVVPGQYIVVLKDNVSGEDSIANEAMKKYGILTSSVFSHAIKGFVFKLPASLPKDVLEENLAALRDDPRVEFISEDHYVSIEAQSLPTGVNRINAESKSNKGTGIHVAVIDTGIDTGHSDLRNNIAGGKNCSTGSSYRDQNGHGTHVAGTIAASNNDRGVVGVAPEAKLWSVRVLDRNGSGTWSSVICGVDFVTSKAPKNGGPITVANMSLGGGGTSDNNCGNTNSDALHKAICNARDAGVTFVVAAGNSGADASQSVPAAYDDAVITVSALADSDGKAGGTGGATSYGADDIFASFSNYGSPVDIAAPGVNIYSTWLSGRYKTISGTSMATPHVAGVAALYIATHPGALWTEVKSALQSLGESLGSGHTDPSGKHPEPVLRADAL